MSNIYILGNSIVSYFLYSVIYIYIYTEQMTEMTTLMKGSPGPPGRGRPGSPGPQGRPGISGLPRSSLQHVH